MRLPLTVPPCILVSLAPSPQPALGEEGKTLQLEGLAEGEEVIVINEGEKEGEGTLQRATRPALPSCPLCDSARFTLVIEEVNGIDLRHETDIEEVNESLLRIESGFVWKRAGGILAAKGEARLDFLVAGKGGPGEYELSRSEARFEVLEWYLEVVTKRADLRIGNQLLRFSKCEIFAPGDLLAPFDLRQPYRGGSFPRVPVIALRADWKLPSDLLITTVIVPFFVPPRFDLFGTDQAILGPGTPPALHESVARIERLVDPSISDRVREALIATELPEEWGLNQSLGLRIEKVADLFETGLTYLFTFGPISQLEISPELLLAMVLLQAGDGATAGQLVSDVISRGGHLMRTLYRRIHVLSLDASLEIGPVAIASEVGWIPEMVFVGLDTSGIFPEVVNVGAGLATISLQATYNYGETFYLSFEAAWAEMLDPRVPGKGMWRTKQPPSLLFWGDRSRQLVLATALKLSLFRGRLEWNFTARGVVLDESLIVATKVSFDFLGRIKPYLGVVFYEVFGDSKDYDLSLTASRDFNDEIFFGLIFR